ncbi:hypothetical protein [Roseivirga pacifica]|uniref:hypothetical protein n=1 Tax=Roseivirga pacifica TaxID=1267423 RepID=UPI0020962ED5|nr:hypothetical protein [Roseivirga pacifica]MCO6357958.1 hypothetical protein [Roseivirga pacifica]MCO6366397.1 hypothetical protein [Roseivirga pacifica]MCO6370882.1 hypothetical protein [Roseivirga pacifica]MCO6380671.1 hypothetical protein [Roseivirga pacifica]
MRHILLVTVLVFCLKSLSAQDGHYWSEQYGNRSLLLAGAVVGSVEDLGAAFYNPSRLALIDNPSFLLSAKVYEFQSLKIEDALGSGDIIKNDEFSSSPALAAGSFRLPFAEGHHFSYAFLTRYQSDINIFYRTEITRDIFDEYPGQELLIGTLDWTKRLREEWFGGAWSYSPKKNFGIGVSLFYAQRKQSNSLNVRMNALSQSNEGADYYNDVNMSYAAKGLITKIGASWVKGRTSYGITITPPRLRLGGKGSFRYEEFMNGVDNSGDFVDDDVFISNSQSDLDAAYNSSLSIAVGAGVKLGQREQHGVHFSAEWFSKLGAYQIMDPAPFVGQSTGLEINAVLYDELKSVVNFGIGGELYFSEHFNTYVGFSTDFLAQYDNESTSILNEEVYNGSFLRSNLFHFSFGGVLDTSIADITFGLLYTGSSEELSRPINIPDNPGETFFNSDETFMVDYTRVRFVFGFTFPFAEDVEQKTMEALGLSGKKKNRR